MSASRAVHGWWKRISLFSCALLSLSRIVSAQADPATSRNPTTLFHEFTLETIGTSDRLPNAVARCITQGPDGRLWIGTLRGLASFDGRSIHNHELPRSEIDREEWIVSAFTANDGSVWFGGDRRLLRHLDGFTSFGPRDGIPDGICESITQDRSGTLYFGIGQRLLKRAGDSFEDIPLGDFIDRELAGGVKVRADRSGSVYVRTDRRVGKLLADGVREIAIERAQRSLWRGFATSPLDGFWIADDDHVFLVRDDQVIRRLAIPSGFRGAAMSLLEDSSGNLWVGSFYYGIVVFLADDRMLTAKLQDGLPHTHITSLCETATGEIFAGSGGAGLFQFRRRLVHSHLDSSEDSAESSIVGVQATAESNVLAISLAGTVSIVDVNDRVTELAKPTFRDVRAAMVRRNGECVVAIPDRGLLVWRSDQWAPLTSPIAIGERTICLHEDDSEQLWIGTVRGLYREHRGIYSDLSARLEIGSGIFGIVASGSEHLVATETGVYRVDGSEQVTRLIDRRDSPVAPIVGICARKDGSIVVADSAGFILRVDGNSLVPVIPGPVTPNTRLGPLIEDDFGQIWSVTEAGILCLDWSGGVLKRRRIGRGSGLDSSDLRVFGQPRLAKTSDGRIWIAANQHGLLSLSPAEIGFHENPPRLILDSVHCDPSHSFTRAADGTYVLPAGTDLIRLQVAAPDFAEPRLRRFEYRLSNAESWVDVGDSQQVLLHHLPPGDYDIEVRSFAARCGWPDAETVIRLTLEPYFWQRRSFIVCIAIAVLGLVSLTMRRYERGRSRALAAKLEQQRSIAHERARFESLFEATSNLVGFVSPAGVILRLNPSASSALIESDPASQPHFETLFPSSERRLLVDTILPTVASHGSWQGRLRMLGRSGAEIPVHLLIHAHRAADGAIDYISWIGHDLSERMRAASQRRSLELQLQRAQKAEALGTLAGGIAHDFNNALTAILGYSELTRDRIDRRGDVELGLSRIVAAAQHARELVARIMTFGRSRPLQVRPSAVEPIAREARELVRAALSPNISLRCEMTPSPLVVIDPTELQQVLVNLLTNASHAIGDATGTIRVSIDPQEVKATLRCVHRDLEPGRYVRIRVSDDGCGIPPDLLERIFDPFFTTKPQGQGTGLGLAVVLGSVSNAGGGILVESHVGRGSTFTLYFPAESANVSAATRSADGAVPSAVSDPLTVEGAKAAAGRSVLIVDDDDLARDALAILLERLGHRVTSHGSSLAAWNAWRTDPTAFDLVVTDLRMPELSGIELARRILAIQPATAIVLVTGYGDTSEIDAIASERVGFLRKPFNLDELAAAIARTMSSETLPT